MCGADVVTRCLGRVLGNQAENYDARNPQNAENNRNAVKVSFCYSRRAEVRRHATAKHVGETTTATAMKQDEQREQQTRQTEKDLKHYLKNLHGMKPFESLSKYTGNSEPPGG